MLVLAAVVDIGVTTDELDRIMHEETADRDCCPLSLNYCKDISAKQRVEVGDVTYIEDSMDEGNTDGLAEERVANSNW